MMKWFAVLCALIVALCWGLYGPTLAHARSPGREWGPFKPYMFIGMAYLVIAIFGSAIMMKFAYNDNFDYTGKYFPAMKWGFLAGSLGALGALGLTFALTKAGGKPSYVMPIIFGGAVSVNAIVAYIGLAKGETVNPLMWVGMALVAVGICLTAGFTPHAHPAPKANELKPEDETASAYSVGSADSSSAESSTSPPGSGSTFKP